MELISKTTSTFISLGRQNLVFNNVDCSSVNVVNVVNGINKFNSVIQKEIVDITL